MRILIVGNGFDLAHDLGTQYTQFMDFANWITSKKYLVQEGKGKEEKLKEYNINKYHELSSISPNIIEELNKLVIDNLWLRYFKSIRGQRKTWIDFESEIAAIMKIFEKGREEYLKKATFLTDAFSASCELKQFYQLLFDGLDINSLYAREFDGKEIGGKAFETQLLYEKKFDGKKFDGKAFDDIRDLLLKHLRNLSRALEIYFSYWVDEYPVDIMSSDIMRIRPDKIISFNYTHTYDRVYNKNYEATEHCYIHGETKKDSALENNVMVLGIHDDNDKRGEYDFLIGFKKYYQKLVFRTDISYKKWFREIGIKKDENHEVYIFGHSLDVTDKEVFAPLLEKENVKCTIFCHSTDKYAELIKKVIALIGKEKTIEKVDAGKIVFVKQKESVTIAESDLAIKTDLFDLDRLDELEFEKTKQLLEKIRSKLIAKDIGYFRSTENVISIADSLCKYGLLTEELSKGIESIIEIDMTNRGDDELLKDYEWGYLDSYGKLEVRPETSSFVDFANSYILGKDDSLEENLLVRHINASKGMNAKELCDVFTSEYEKSLKSGRFAKDTLNYIQKMLGDDYAGAREGIDMFKHIESSKENYDIKQIFTSLLEKMLDESFVQGM